MTLRPLAAPATLESLKKQAKTFLKAVRAGDGAALARLAPYFSDPAGAGLQDVQMMIAREHGFSSWTKLKAHLEAPLAAGETPEQRANRFLSLACLSYFARIAADPGRFEEAGHLLESHPGVADHSIHVAAAIGDGERVARWLEREPRLIERRGGPYDWPPLLYAAYARVPGRSSLSAARMLIARGADANAFFLDDGQYRFTALTGVFGEGEAGKVRQPPHPDCAAFARLLLDAGADANDSQALYNRMFEPDNSCLELLLEYGLSASDRNNWLVREDGRLVANAETVFDYQLAWALQKRMPQRVRLLVEHGADVHRAVGGRTPYEWARLGGDAGLAAYLVGKGAVAVRLQPEDWAYTQIIYGVLAVEDLARVMGATTTVADIQRKHPAMLHGAAGDNEMERVRRMLALGFSVDAMTSRTPLHEAALHGHLDMARLLIAHGADPTIRDPHHYAPPIGWADYNGHDEMVAFLRTQPLDVFAAAAYGETGRLGLLLDADPALIEKRFADIRPKGRPSPDRDGLTPLGFAALNGRIEAVRLLLDRGADRSIRDAAGRSYADLALEAGEEAVAALLKRPTPAVP